MQQPQLRPVQCPPPRPIAAAAPLQPHPSRRSLLALALALTVSSSPPLVFAASATSLEPNNQLIQQLLERSRANKAKNNQQRLDDYYERNFKEYFEFVEGTIKNKTDLTETEKGIIKWLEDYRNKKR